MFIVNKSKSAKENMPFNSSVQQSRASVFDTVDPVFDVMLSQTYSYSRKLLLTAFCLMLSIKDSVNTKLANSLTLLWALGKDI